jgi:hypothetical protein
MSAIQIRQAVQDVLGAYEAFPQLMYAPNDMFELYLLSLVATAAEEEEATLIEFRDASNTRATTLWFRRSPGSLHVAGAFTHLRIEFPDREALEAHVGVRVRGVSGVAHECDVAVLKESECDRSRANLLLPRSQGLVLAVEGKYYSDSLPLHMGRGVLGLGKELKGKATALVTNIGANDIVHMVMHHHNHANDAVLPGTGNNDRFVGFVAQQFYRYKR